MMYTQANYFAVLPAAVRYDPELSARAKLLYAALTSLAVGEGIAYPSNAYIAETFDVDERTVQRLISELDALKYITVGFEYRENTKEIARRVIRIAPLPALLDLPKTAALYAVIPSHILSLSELSVQAKLLYAEISAATPTDGYCSKPATFFAELLNVSETSIQRWTRELVACDALRVELDYIGDTREIRRRRIYLTEAAAIVEKRRQIAQDSRKDSASDMQPSEHDAANTPQGSRILGGDKNDTTYAAAFAEPDRYTRHPNRRRNKRGKRKKLTQKLCE